ncbi:NAD-dependent epimerase/dehydratase family protein [Marinobacter confluentis]|uniref:NAD-dependent epimerase/dehydratase family protein n=1 Tax=Marinobacter confluentis TaxID=1697557 RepID=A0A4Z1C579_9GAMM|nr:NAD-dependent epimerase/dehydratase family protein [Marinobacter confluentis]TGN38321.1 NAD-dependent epimerase/dehydratase family protein [Marinobacter confluentis]
MAITEDKQIPRILVAGCGNLGGAIASRLAEDFRVFGMRRTASQIPEAVQPVAADLLDRDQLASVLPEQLDIVIYCLTPSQYDETGYQNAFVTGLNNLLHALEGQSLKRLFFISSSSVYSQNDDSWVDETSPTEPARFSGEIILDGEKTAQSSAHPATIVRFSGIYGPSRRRFLQAVMEGEMDPASPAPYSNRIHEADAAGAVCHLTRLALAGAPLEPCYLASDCEPARLDEVVAWVRQQLPCKAPDPDARKGGRAGSKRCSNQRLLDTGFRFSYPDFRAGYGEMIEQQKQHS